MGCIVAIGGGEIGHGGSEPETTEIDRRIIGCTGKERPQILFIPTASGDSERYVDVFTEHYGGRLGCSVDVLRLVETPDSSDEITAKIDWADAVYVGGGNPVSMIKAWKARGVDILLKEAYERGLVLSGLSAGAICWFRKALSDTLKFDNPGAPLTLISSLDFHPLTVCPHFDGEADRRPGFKEALKGTGLIGLGIDNCAALEVREGVLFALSSREGAHVWKCYWNGDEYREEPLEEGIGYEIHNLGLERDSI
ncbi:MAG: peptidase E [Spirochaetales bacterium]|nr:peptidase E [Spirochaetales bacterium]